MDAQTEETKAVAEAFESNAKDTPKKSYIDNALDEVAGSDKLTHKDDEPAKVEVAERFDGKPIPEAQIIVEEVDRLKAENLNLKLINAVSRVAILENQMKELTAQQVELQKVREALTGEMQNMRAAVEKKYSIDLATHHIMPETGQVVPRPQQAGNMDPAAMAAAIKQRQAAQG